MSSLHKWLGQFPALLNACSCVDIYQPWSQEALVNVAEQWLRVPTMDAYTRKARSRARIRQPLCLSHRSRESNHEPTPCALWEVFWTHEFVQEFLAWLREVTSLCNTISVVSTS